MRRADSLKKIKSLSVDERLDLATRKTSRLIDRMLPLIQTHANNRIISYSDTLAGQIPKSHAAHAFNDFQRAMLTSEFTSLIAFWDAIDFDKDSVPTVYELLDDPCVIKELHARKLKQAYASYGNVSILNANELDPYTLKISYRMHMKDEVQRTQREFRAQLNKLQILVPLLQKSQRLANIAGYRDRFIAHHIDTDLAEPTSRGRVYSAPRYGQERRLLRTTCKILNLLNGFLRDAWFDFDGSFEISTRNSETLWQNCSFTNLS